MRTLKFGFAALMMLSALSCFGQRDVDDQSDWKERIYFGGGGGFSGGTNYYGTKYFYFSLSPVVGYMLTSHASVGTGILYQRYSYPDFHFNYTQYGVAPFVRYNFNQLFLISEYDYINLPIILANSQGYSESDRVFQSRLLFGAGFSQPLGGGRTKINVVGMYDVLYKRPSYFLSPWVFRVFFSF